ncbi:MAG: hypothetical protein RLY78_575 [Pseudomonadota bacterium]|jgi:hypothetical protein|uniref:Uncharacterized protein n=1 Tax=Pseudaquabacterium rugosum TaxID=2984194 RepID=A0ABU9B7V4_9BURK
MLVFRLVFGLLLVAALLCFAFALATGQGVWRRRGVLLLKWTLLAAAGFFAVLMLERLAVLL